MFLPFCVLVESFLKLIFGLFFHKTLLLIEIFNVQMQSNYSETNFVGREKDAIFFSSLVVRMEKRYNSNCYPLPQCFSFSPLFYQKTYRVFTKDAAEGDHLSGDLRFEVCTNGSCDAIEKHVSHLGLIVSFVQKKLILELNLNFSY